MMRCLTVAIGCATIYIAGYIMGYDAPHPLDQQESQMTQTLFAAGSRIFCGNLHGHSTIPMAARRRARWCATPSMPAPLSPSSTRNGTR